MASLIFLRLRATQTVTEVVEERTRRRIAQELLEEKLAEALAGKVEEAVGEVPGRPGWTWEWQEEVVEEGDEFLLVYTLRLHLPPKNEEGVEETYELKTWVLPTEEQKEEILAERELMEEEGYGTGTGYSQ